MNCQPNSEWVLELEDVAYRRENKEIISGVSLSVGAGEHWAYLVRMGRGKAP